MRACVEHNGAASREAGQLAEWQEVRDGARDVGTPLVPSEVCDVRLSNLNNLCKMLCLQG